MSESEWTKILGWPRYRVYRNEINEAAKTLRLWVRRKRGNRKLECSGCGRKINEIVFQAALSDRVILTGSDRVGWCPSGFWVEGSNDILPQAHSETA